MFNFLELMRSFNPVRPGLAALAVCVAVIWSPQSFAESVPEPTAGPALWKVEGGSAEIYLFGTFHILPPNVEWQTGIVGAAMAASDTLVTEADTSNEEELGALVMAHAFNRDGKTLRDYFTDEEAALVEAGLAPFGLNFENAATFRPWMVSLQVSLMAMMKLGFDPEKGVESILEETAAQRNMKLDYLETGEASVMALAGHSDAVQVQVLLATFEELATLEQDLGKMVKAWSVGDVEQVAELMNGSVEQIPGVMEALLYDRNRNWIPHIEKMAASDGSYFIAVGAAHLAGEQSLVELLEAKGYKVVRQ